MNIISNIIGKIFPRKRSKDEMLKDFIYDQCEPWPASDICPPPINGNKAMSILFEYFMGPNAYISMSVSPRQANSEIMYEIMSRHKGHKDFMKELKKKYGTIQECEK